MIAFKRGIRRQAFTRKETFIREHAFYQTRTTNIMRNDRLSEILCLMWQNTTFLYIKLEFSELLSNRQTFSIPIKAYHKEMLPSFHS